MKTKLILIAVLFLPTLIMKGQGGDGGFMRQCFIDSRTGDTIRNTFWKMLDISPRYVMNFRMGRVNSDFTFELTGSDLMTIQKGDSLWIKFVGGYTISLYAIGSSKINPGEAMVPGDMENPSSFGVAVKYRVPNDKLMALCGNEIEKIRIYSSLGKSDIEVRVEYRPLTVKAANLMIEKRKIKVRTDRNNSDW